MYVFLKNKVGIAMKNTQSADFCADKIDVMTNFVVKMNVVIKRVHYSILNLSKYLFSIKTKFFSYRVTRPKHIN